MADDLTVKSPGAGSVGAQDALEASAPSPQEEKFQTFVESARSRGVQLPESALKRIFERGQSRVQASDALSESSQAHFTSQDANGIQSTGASRQEAAAELTGATKTRDISTGLTPETKKAIAGDIRSTPVLPLPTSHAITADEAEAFVTEILQNRTAGGEPIDLDALVEEFAKGKSKSSPTSSTPRRTGSGSSALSMRIGGGGTNLATKASAPSQGYSSSSMDDMDFSWKNLHSFFIMFLMREEERSLTDRKLLKGLRTAEAESSQQGRKLDFTMTDVRQTLERHGAMRDLIKASNTYSTELVGAKFNAAFGTDGVNPENLEKEDEADFMQDLEKKMQSTVKDYGTHPPKDQASELAGKRTFLTDSELANLKETNPEAAKAYQKTMGTWLYSAGKARQIAVMRQDALLLAKPPADADSTPLASGVDAEITALSDDDSGSDDQPSTTRTRDGGPYAEQIAAAKHQMDDWINAGCLDPRGMGMALENHRDGAHQQARKHAATAAEYQKEIQELRGKLAEAPKDSEEAKGFQKEIDLKTNQRAEVRRAQFIELETLNVIDNALVPRRPTHDEVGENHANGAASTATENEKLQETIDDNDAKIKTLGGTPKEKEEKEALQAQNKNLKKEQESNNRTQARLDTLLKSYQARIAPDDLDIAGPGTGQLEPGTSAEISEVGSDLPKNLDQRLIDLEARAKAGEKFFKGRSGKLGDTRGGLYRGQLERTINATLSRLEDALKKPADSLRNQANKFVQQAIGSAKSNAKQTGAMIQKTRGMTERLLETAARMRR